MRNGAFAEGVAIIAKHVKSDDFGVYAEHDQMWFGSVGDVPPDDAEKLKALGWFEDKEAWSCFT